MGREEHLGGMMFKWLMLLMMFTACTISTPAKGEKIGRIVKLSSEGIVFKTVEGELIRGGVVDGTGSMGTSFKFTIEDPRLVQIAHDAFEKQSEVILTYESELISFLGRSECTEPHFVKSIQVVR